MPPTRTQVDEPRPGDVLSLDLDLLDDNPFQPRTKMDPAKLEELVASIAQSGLLQPIAVRPDGPGRYQIVAGHRRVAAFRKLRTQAKTDSERRRHELIRAHVVPAVTDSEMAVAAYVENAQRDNLNPLDEAAALARIRDLGGHTTANQVAHVTGQHERRVRRLLRLVTAPSVVKDCVSIGLLVEAADDGAPPKRERRKIELMAALEFTRLHEHHQRRNAATADERTTTAIARALRANWGLRRIQTYVEATIKNTVPTAPTNTNQALPAEEVPPAKDKGTDDRDGDHEPHEVCASSSGLFTLYLSRLKAASRQQLEAALAMLDDARQLVEAQMLLKP